MPTVGITTRVDVGNWVPGCTVVSATGGAGLLAQNITSVVGPQGTSPLFDLLQFPADTGYEVRWALVSGFTLGGVLRLEEDGRASYSGVADSGVIEYWLGGESQGTATLAFTDTSITLVTSDLTCTYQIAALVTSDLSCSFQLAALVRSDLQVVYTLAPQAVNSAPSRTVPFQGGSRTVHFQGGNRTVRF